ncbi:MAG: hypothetical protein WB814_13330 [Candidatus Sulfotelmatobacter sp.]
MNDSKNHYPVVVDSIEDQMFGESRNSYPTKSDKFGSGEMASYSGYQDFSRFGAKLKSLRLPIAPLTLDPSGDRTNQIAQGCLLQRRH